MAMATSAAMSQVAKKAGTLVVVVMKAKNLPNRQKIGKQDPYCIVRLSHTAERTKTDKRGGQSPFWDHETRFPIPLNAGPEHSTLKVTVFSDESKDPVLIGDASIDLKSVYKDGEFDEWVELKFKNRYAGEIYLEMTYYSEAPPPIPALPKEVQSRGLQSRGGSQPGSLTRLKRRPLPQQPDLAALGPPPPSRGFPRHPYEQLPPSTSHSTRSSFSGYDHHYSEPFQSEPYSYERHPRQYSLDYQDPHHSMDYGLQQQSHEYPQYHQPQSPTLGRHRSEASLRTQYYEIRPLNEVEPVERYPPSAFREEPRIRPRTSLPLVPQSQPYYDPVPPPEPSPNIHYRKPVRQQSLDNYYHTPPPEERLPQIPSREPSLQGFYDDLDEPIPVYPYVSSSRQMSSPPTQTYSPHAQQHTPSHSLHMSQGQPYSPHTPQPPPAVPQKYSPTPPVHRVPTTPDPPPPSRSSASPRTPLNGPSPHPVLKKPSPIRAIDHLPPSSYAPEHTPPSQRRPLPTPPGVNSSPSEYSQQSSPLAHRIPEVPAKIPLGMTEREFWATRELDESVDEGLQMSSLRGLHDDGGWREMRDALPSIGYARR